MMRKIKPYVFGKRFMNAYNKVLEKERQAKILKEEQELEAQRIKEQKERKKEEKIKKEFVVIIQHSNKFIVEI